MANLLGVSRVDLTKECDNYYSVKLKWIKDSCEGRAKDDSSEE